MTEISAETFTAWMTRFASLVQENQAHLTDLDAAIGDADHGANMARGTKAAVDALEAEGALGALARKVGMALVANVGGASGPLFGTFFMRLGGALGDAETADHAAFAAALQAGCDGVAARGKATTGEKTMLDAMVPACEAFSNESELSAAAAAAKQAAIAGRDATEPMVATKGRASYLGERSAGHIDPGAASTALLFEALEASLA